MAKLAVIGKDVSKSASPSIHTFIARELGLDMTYENISIPEDKFEEEIEKLLKEYDGFNVTIPYKLSVIPHLKKIEGDAQTFGAVNTVACSTLTGYNTDGLGFMQMLSAEGVEVKGAKVMLLGAGGAGRSVAKKLIDGGATVEIYDRFQENAKKVAEEFGSITVLNEIVPHPVDIIVNATGVGMHKTEGVSPVSEEVIALCRTAVDLIYVPAKSRFLEIAESLNKKIINGSAMLFYQAYYSDSYYYGFTPDPVKSAELFKKYQKEIKL
ncbi:MAG: shikimate dehydrogenase family protein [Candidatus Coproplasma sp.]